MVEGLGIRQFKMKRIKMSVEAALWRGTVILVLIPMSPFLLIVALSFFLTNKKVLPEYFIGIAILLGLIISWLIWSFQATKWRIWAFSNVTDVHELKRRAIQNSLIWKDGSIFERTEIRSRRQKDQLKEIKKRRNC